MHSCVATPSTIQGIINFASGHLQSVSQVARRYARTQTSQLAKDNQKTSEGDYLLSDQSLLLQNPALRDLDIKCAAAVLHPALECVRHRSNEFIKTDDWHVNHTSCDTFFQNKHGFSESDMWLSTFGDRPLGVIIPGHSLSFKSSGGLFYSQMRGFKTHRSAGIDKKNEAVATSVLEKVKLKLGQSSKARRTDRLKELISSVDSSPEMQANLKVAFAEGYAANDKPQNNQDSNIIRKVAKFAVIGFILYIIYNVLETLEVELKSSLKKDVAKVSPENTGVSFDDVKGADEAKQELKDIVAFLKDPERFEAIGAKLPKGILLVGSPGIGKTLLARAVAGEAGVPFFHASGSDFEEMFVGMGAKRVRNLFESAKVNSPCIIFIDEIDSVGSKRTESNIHPYANQTINQLLSEMDGYSSNEGVIILAATNRRHTLDKALLRPGRFDMEVHIHLPDMKGRREIFQHYLDKVETDSAVDAEKLAMGTAGFSGAEIENVVNQAALHAVLAGEECVTVEHLDFARDKVLMGPAKKHRIMDEATNVNTAYHEAGHTLVAYYTEDATPIHKVTIIPRGSSLGHTSFIPDKEQYQVTKAQLLAQMDVAMGGRVAEEIIFGADQVSTGASNDFQQATAIATAMVKKYGMSERVGVRVFDEEMVPTLYGTTVPTSTHASADTAELLDSEIKRYLQESYERAANILKTHSPELKALSAALMKYDTLDAKDVKSIVENRTPALPT